MSTPNNSNTNSNSNNVNNQTIEDESGIDQSLDDIMDTASRANETCRDFQRGYCPRGDRCWFKHIPGENQIPDADLAAPGVVASLGGRALCRDYIRGHCRRGVECPFFHVKGGERCRDFERLQDCRRGIFCPFLHVSIQPRTPNPAAAAGGAGSASPLSISPVSSGLLPLKPNFAFEHEGENVYDRTLPPPSSSPSSQYYPRRQYEAYPRIPKSFAAPGVLPSDLKVPLIKTELCRDWGRFNGDCPRGAACQYLHGHPGDVCRDFSRRGRCYRGDNCPFTHHPQHTTTPTSPSPSSHHHHHHPDHHHHHHQHQQQHQHQHQQQRSQQTCRKYLRGECTHGSSCNYYHPPMNTATVGSGGGGVPAGGEEGGQHHEYSRNDFN